MRAEVGGFCLGVVFFIGSYLIRCGLCFLPVFCLFMGLLFGATIGPGFDIGGYLEISGSFRVMI